MDILLYIPADARGPVPVFAGLNFGGNHTVHADPGIRLGEVWTRDPKDRNRHTKQPAADAQRGAAHRNGRWRKFWRAATPSPRHTTATSSPTSPAGCRTASASLSLGGGQTDPKADQWGAIGAWAWGLSRIADYLQTDRAIDSKKIALMGHSRLGKAALWAGAQDTRFALVVSNESGEGGASLARRNFGETLMRIDAAFPHWFCLNYHQYGPDPNTMPVDQHELLALIAPRPLYVASAAQDLHSDPKGEFLAAVAAGPVYELLGKQGLGTSEVPPLNRSIMHDSDTTTVRASTTSLSMTGSSISLRGPPLQVDPVAVSMSGGLDAGRRCHKRRATRTGLLTLLGRG